MKIFIEFFSNSNFELKNLKRKLHGEGREGRENKSERERINLNIFKHKIK